MTDGVYDKASAFTAPGLCFGVEELFLFQEP